MGSVGDAYDNAMAESFFSTLEAELLSRRRFASQAEAKMACFSYIEGWYNPVRLHSGLGHRSPITYEADMQATMTAVTSDAPCLAWWIGLASEARDAVGGWIEGQTAQQEGKRLLGDLPRLPGGEGYLWVPDRGILDRVVIAAIRTFAALARPSVA